MSREKLSASECGILVNLQPIMDQIINPDPYNFGHYRVKDGDQYTTFLCGQFFTRHFPIEPTSTLPTIRLEEINLPRPFQPSVWKRSSPWGSAIYLLTLRFQPAPVPVRATHPEIDGLKYPYIFQ